MLTEYDFFLIEKEHLKDNKTFPFQLYVFNPINKKYTMILNGNRPLTKEIDEFIDYLLSRGGKLAILRRQKKTFLIAQETPEESIPTLKNKEIHPLEKERIMHIKLKEMHEEKHGKFKFQSEFEKAVQTDNFSIIIEAARMEILTFSVTESYTTSLAIHFAKEFLVKDNYQNRVIATAVHLAKTLNIDSHIVLGDLIVGLYLHHIGYTQIALSTCRKPYLQLFDSEKKTFQKHTVLGNHLIKRTGIEISETAKKIIHDHHERHSGNGYPNEISGSSIETIVLLAGAVTHLFEYSTGKINGTKQSIKSIIYNIKNKTYSPGLEVDFGDTILNGLVNLINLDKIEENENENEYNQKAA